MSDEPDLVRAPARSVSASFLFTLLWESLADILGTTACATLVRRSLRRAIPGRPSLAGVVVSRDGLEYRYTLPLSWHNARDPEALEALRDLTRALWPLVVDLTGVVVVRRLRSVPDLVRHGLVPLESEQ